jgi:hypothetical protein
MISWHNYWRIPGSSDNKEIFSPATFIAPSSLFSIHIDLFAKAFEITSLFLLIKFYNVIIECELRIMNYLIELFNLSYG